MVSFDDFLQEQLEDEEFRKEFEAIQPKLDSIRAEIEEKSAVGYFVRKAVDKKNHK